MVMKIWVNIGSGNGLLPDGTKPLPERMLTYHQQGLVNTMGLYKLTGHWEIWMKLNKSNFSANFTDQWLMRLLWKCPYMNTTEPYWW